MMTVNNFSELIDGISTIIDARPSETWWWRGHARKDWSLRPSVHRGDLGHRYEQNSLATFVRYSSARHANCPARNDLPSWAFLMQHYGVPTRLLDWSESPLIAVYFAVANQAHEAEAGVLSGLLPGPMNHHEAGLAGVIGINGEPARSLFLAMSDERIHEKHQEIIAIQANQMDPRMLAQLSHFTIHGRATPIEQIDVAGQVLFQIEIAPQAKAGIRERLRQFGVREMNLFPDLEHLANEIRELRWKAPES